MTSSSKRTASRRKFATSPGKPDLPLTIGLLVDTSVSQERVIGPQKQAAAQFFEDVLRQNKDLAFLISFDVDIELLQDLTNSGKLLRTALQRLRVPGKPRRPAPRPGPAIAATGRNRAVRLGLFGGPRGSQRAGRAQSRRADFRRQRLRQPS